ncbi:MAG: hypothetical protein MUF15_18095, partial [Acidobacteria bacterium]|nr:hypothetical protein [Acidobacteriota bacterium]
MLFNNVDRYTDNIRTSPMYLLNLHYENDRLNGTGSIDFHTNETMIKKWTFLSDGTKNLELL